MVYTGITRERLEREGHAAMALPKRAAEGHVLPFSDRELVGTPSGRGELTPVPVFVPPAESRGGAMAKDGLVSAGVSAAQGGQLYELHLANLPGHQKMEAGKEGRLEMHPGDAAARGIATGDTVEVFNARGSVRLQALVDGVVPRGVVAAQSELEHRLEAANGAQRNINALTSERLTDMGGGATFYSTLVEVKRASSPA